MFNPVCFTTVFCHKVPLIWTWVIFLSLGRLFAYWFISSPLKSSAHVLSVSFKIFLWVTSMRKSLKLTKTFVVNQPRRMQTVCPENDDALSWFSKHDSVQISLSSLKGFKSRKWICVKEMFKLSVKLLWVLSRYAQNFSSSVSDPDHSGRILSMYLPHQTILDISAEYADVPPTIP